MLPTSVFYGWWVTLACGLVLFVAVGIGFYVLPLFLQPIQETHGWSAATVSAATGVYFSMNGLAQLFVGPLIDRHDPRIFISVGVIGMGASLALVGQLSAIWHLFAVYILLAIFFAMASNTPISAIITRWWITRRARAMSVAFSFISLGGALFAPLGRRFLDQGGLSLAAPVLGLIVIAIALPPTLFVMVSSPAFLGLEPDGVSGNELDESPSTTAAAPARLWTRAEAMRTRPFWAILFGFMLVLVCQIGFLAHQIAFLQTRYSASVAATAVSVTALGSAGARLVVGGVADQLDKRLLTVGLIVVQASAVLAIQATSSLWVDLGLVLVFGFTMGNIFMMQSLLVGEIYGMASFGTIYGAASSVGQILSGLGPIGVGLLVDATDGYRIPFLVTGSLTLLAAAVISQARPLGPTPSGSVA